MSLIPFLFGLSTKLQIKKYLSVALNGDLSPTALDQLQIFVNDSIVINGNAAKIFYTGNGQGDGSGDIDLGFLAEKDMTDGLPIYEGWVRWKDGGADAAVIIDAGTAGQWDDQQVLLRTVIYDTTDLIYKMWYIGATAGVYSIGYATSTDGRAWTKYVSNPVLSGSTPLVNNSIIFFAVYKESDTLYHAIASGERDLNETGGIYYTSVDGINWTEQNKPVMLGSGARAVLSIRKNGPLYYLYCEGGANLSYSGNYGGISTETLLYSTTDFNTFNYIDTIIGSDEPSESGHNAGSTFEYGGKHYYLYSYFKNQVKDLNVALQPEPFMGLRFLESPVPFLGSRTYQKVYPDYLKRYYPLYELPESQSPLEIINGDSPTVTGTLVWNFMRYVLFDGNETIQYPSYTPTDLTKFAVKARISPETGSVHNIVRQDNTTDRRFWSMYLGSTGLLEVILFDDSDNIAKHYRTVSAPVKPPGVWDENDNVSVGFIFNSGTLQVLYGDGIQAVTQLTDDPLTEISPKDTPVIINANSSTIEIRSICIFDEITEDQWLNVIDL